MGQQGTRRALRPEETHTEAPAGPRPFWSGTITFGLVSIPVNLFTAVRSYGVRTRMLAPDGTPVQRRYYCPQDEQDVDREHLVRGFEVEPDKYVVVTDEELEAIAPRKSRDIDLRRFVDVDELDPFLFERGYVLTPGGESEKAYRLLADVMERENKAGIATFVMRGKEYLIAIMAEKGILRAETLRFCDEIRSPKDVGLPERGPAPAKLVSAFEQAIRKDAKPDVARSELSDRRTRELEKLVERKRESGKNVIEAPEPPPDEEEETEGGSTVDLMEAIRRSLQGAASEPKRARRSERAESQRTRTAKSERARRGRSQHARAGGRAKPKRAAASAASKPSARPKRVKGRRS